MLFGTGLVCYISNITSMESTEKSKIKEFVLILSEHDARLQPNSKSFNIEKTDIYSLRTRSRKEKEEVEKDAGVTFVNKKRKEKKERRNLNKKKAIVNI